MVNESPFNKDLPDEDYDNFEDDFEDFEDDFEDFEDEFEDEAIEDLKKHHRNEVDASSEQSDLYSHSENLTKQQIKNVTHNEVNEVRAGGEDFSKYQNEKINGNLLKNLSITVSAEAGQIILSLQQLVNLEVNQVLDIAPMPPKVNLVVNGVNIGNGFLVEINGRVGVKIAHLNSGINVSA